MPRTPEDEYDRWLTDQSYEQVVGRFSGLGCTTVLLKKLSNDNSKNQVYIGGELPGVSLIPSGELAPFPGRSTKKAHSGPIYQAPVELVWVAPSGLAPAPEAKMIYYPQYPEVRMSGFLQGCADPPRSLMVREKRGMEAGRLLVLAVHPEGRVYAMVLPSGAQAVTPLLMTATEPYGVFSLLRLVGSETPDPRAALLEALCVIHRRGWHPGQRIAKGGQRVAYTARNAVGYTLEALLGVAPNGTAEPDFAGWEVKAHNIGQDFTRPKAAVLTLLTPEPDGGVYHDAGVEAFMLDYGYAQPGVPDRYDYAGTQRVGDALHPKAGTRLQLDGFDSQTAAITTDGSIGLVDAHGTVAASWSFAKLLNHWKTKHARTVFVPTITRMSETTPPQLVTPAQYQYGNKVLLGEGTSFARFLSAVQAGTVYYDPGTNMQRTPTGWKAHRRNQFRSRFSDLDRLYDSTETVAVCTGRGDPQRMGSPRALERRPVWVQGDLTVQDEGRERITIHPTATKTHNLQQTPTKGLFTFADLFAGIGGTRLGFEAAGGECVFTSEWNPFAQQTYAANFSHRGEHEFNDDITTLDPVSVPDHDVLLAGFPCQPFSIAGVSKKNALGRPHGFTDLTQGTLFFDVARIIEQKRPRAFMLENVKNLVSHDKGNTFKVIMQTLRDELGYTVQARVMDASPFVPQGRKRIIIVGFESGPEFDFDALDIPTTSPRMRMVLHTEDGNESPEAPYTEGPLARVADKYTLTPKLWAYLQNYAVKHRKAGNGFGFGLVNPDSVARTLSARYYKDASEILVSRGPGEIPRRLTPRECARLMGFPDSYRIPVSDTQAYKQFGNSVVVPVIRSVAHAMVPQLLRGRR